MPLSRIASSHSTLCRPPRLIYAYLFVPVVHRAFHHKRVFAANLRDEQLRVCLIVSDVRHLPAQALRTRAFALAVLSLPALLGRWGIQAPSLDPVAHTGRRDPQFGCDLGKLEGVRILPARRLIHSFRADG